MIYKFHCNGNVLEFSKCDDTCLVELFNDTSEHQECIESTYLDSQQIYDLIGALNEIKKRIEREGK